MTKKRVNPVQIDTVAGGCVAKKAKIIPKDPFEGEFKQMFVEVPNEFMSAVLDKLFNRDCSSCRYEVSNYRCEIAGVTKSICGMTRFVEETKSCFTLTYEAGKREEIINILNELFPYCTFADK